MATDSSGAYVLLARLADEFAARLRSGERPSLQEYVDRHPDLADEIRQLFPAMVEIEQVKEEHRADQPATAKSAEILPFQQLGDYRILREIGRGGMGVVYEAEQISLGRHVALKVLPRRLIGDARQQRRFEREAKAAAKLHHTNIVPVFGVGEHDGLSYYVMQFIQGLGLDEVLDELRRMRRDGPAAASRTKDTGYSARLSVSAAKVAQSLATGKFDPDPDATIDNPQDRSGALHGEGADRTLMGSVASRSDSSSPSSSSVLLPGQSEHGRKPRAKSPTYAQSVARIGVQVADALDYAHRQQILHRDIKPSNLLLDTCGTVWITDFGLAKTDDQQNLTNTGDILGTLRYMPPEAFEGKTDARSDEYSLGLTLYELLAFRPAFDERDRPRLIGQVTMAEFPRLGSVNPEVPRDLETIIHKAIDREPAHRYQTAGDLARDLQCFLDDEPIKARRLSPWERLGRLARRNKGVAAALSVVTVLLVVIAVGSLVAAAYFRRQEQEQSRLAKKNQALAVEKGQLADEKENEAARANQAKQAAEGAREEANAARHKAETQERLARRRFYAAQIILASQALQTSQPTRALEFLESQRPFEGEEDLRTFDWYHLWYELRRDLQRSLAGHSGGCSAIAILPDGKTLVSADGAGRLRLWSIASGELRKLWQAHQGAIACLAVSPDGQKLASATHDGQVRWWDSGTGRELGTLSVGMVCSSLVWRKDGKALFVGCGDGSIHYLTLQNGAQRQSFKPNDAHVHCLLMTPDDKFLVSARGWGIDDSGKGIGKTLIHDVTQWPPKLVAQLPGALVLALAPDAQTLALARFHDVMLWDLKTNKERLRLEGHQGAIHGLAFSPDGTRLLSGCLDDRTLALWDVRTGRQLAKRASRGGVHGIKAIPGGLGWAVAGTGETVDFWDPAGTDGASVLTDENNSASVLTDEKAGGRVLMAPDGTTVITTGKVAARQNDSQRSIVESRRWDLATGKFLELLPAVGTPVAVSSDGSTLLSLEPSKDYFAYFDTVHLFQMDSGKKLATFTMQKLGRGEAVLAPNAQWAAAANEEPIRVWNLQGNQPRLAYDLPGRIGCLGFAPDSQTLAVCQENGTIRLWSLATARWTDEFRHGPKSISSMAFSRDGARFATADEAGTIRIWEIATRELVGTIKGDVEILIMRFFPDDRTVACGRSDGAIILCDVATFQEKLMLRAHTGRITSLDVAPDGRTMVSAGMNTVRIWRTARDAEAIARKNPLDRDDPDSPVAQKERGDRLLVAQHDREAELVYRNVIERVARLKDQFPEKIDYAHWLAVACTALGDLLLDAGRASEAMPEYRLASSGWDTALAKFPDNPEYRAERFRLAVQLIPILAETGLDQAAERERSVVRGAAANDGVRCMELAWGIVKSPGRKPAAVARALQLATAAVALSPNDRSWQQTLGVAYYRAGQWEAAVDAFEKSVSLSNGASMAPDAFFLAMANHQLGDRQRALQWLRVGQFWMERLEPKDSNDQSLAARIEAATLLGVPQTASNLPPTSDQNRRQFLDMVRELMPSAAWAR